MMSRSLLQRGRSVLSQGPKTSARGLATSVNPSRETVSAAHWEDKWSQDEMQSASDEHCMASWGPGAPLRAIPFLERGEGVYLFDSKGNKYLDWTSQAVCTNLGYDVPPAVIEAVTKQVGALVV